MNVYDSLLEISKNIWFWLERNQVIANKGKYFCNKFISHGDLSKKKGNPDLYYDDGGILDPVTGRVMGEHYSTSHFALMGALLHIITNDARYLSSSIRAMDFQFRTRFSYKYADWGPHRDFNNLAVLLVDGLIGSLMEKGTRKRWKIMIRTMIPQRNPACNWVAMRAYTFLLKSKRYPSSLLSRFYGWYMLRLLLDYQDNDGCFHDVKKDSAPIQYHAYTLALVYQIWKVLKKEYIKDAFLRGVDWLSSHADPKGEFNYKGRGQKQIFGYGVYIYCMMAAFSLTGDEKFGNSVIACINHLKSFCGIDGSFPLVLNSVPNEKRAGWYDYHHVTVYNAFLGAWLLLTLHDFNKLNLSHCDGKVIPQQVFYPSSGEAILCNKNWFVCISRGEKEYEADCGLTPMHITLKDGRTIFSCPAGPVSRKYGTKSPLKTAGLNTIAPLVMKNGIINWCGLRVAENMELKHGNVMMRMRYGGLLVQRTVSLHERSLIINDFIKITEHCGVSWFRPVNIPLPSTYKATIDDMSILIPDVCVTVKGIDGKYQIKKYENLLTAIGEVEVFAIQIDNIGDLDEMDVEICLEYTGN